MRKVLITFIFFACLSVQAQPLTQTWAGRYAGTLTIFPAKGTPKTVPMRLEIVPIDSLRSTFTLVYGSGDKTDRRPYELITLDAPGGRYLIDEKNSIKMEAYRLGNRLLCQFEVGSNRLLTAYERTDPQTIVFEVISGSTQPVSTTGGQKVGTDDIPAVRAYAVSGFQRAVLRRE